MCRDDDVLEIAFEQDAVFASESSDSFLFNLANAFASQIEFCADFFKGHFLTSDTEEHFDDFSVAFFKLLQSAVYFRDEGFVVEA